MKIAICEDEKRAQNQLNEAINDWAKSRNVNVDIFSYESAESFLMAWPEIRFDLAFFDIQMKNITGIELAEQIRKSDKDMLIVFITSHKQYALKGYDVNAFHYLIKPLSSAKLLPILDKAHLIWLSNQDASILISDNCGNQIKLSYNDIYYISKQSNIAVVNTAKESYEIRKTIDGFLRILPGHFVRCHRSYIVNLYKIGSLYKNSLTLSNGGTLPVSRDNAKTISEAFMRMFIGR